MKKIKNSQPQTKFTGSYKKEGIPRRRKRRKKEKEKGPFSYTN